MSLNHHDTRVIGLLVAALAFMTEQAIGDQPGVHLSNVLKKTDADKLQRAMNWITTIEPSERFPQSAIDRTVAVITGELAQRPAAA